MRKSRAQIVAAAAVLLLCAGGAFAYRQDIADALHRAQRGPLPQEISREDILKQRAEAATNSAATNTNTTKPVATKPTPTVPATNSAPKPAQKPIEETPAPKPDEPVKTAPAQMSLKMLFVPQAPFKNWDEIHEDACEEASVIMVQAYIEGQTSMSLEEMDRRIMELVDYQNKTYGDFKSTDAATTVDFMHKVLGLKTAKILPVQTADDIRAQIALGRPVILPADGRALNNPNFRNGGPPYHMLVVKGYRSDGKFVTNDPGTRLGENYLYDADVLMNAIHDWNGGDVIHGKKVMIVVEE